MIVAFKGIRKPSLNTTSHENVVQTQAAIEAFKGIREPATKARNPEGIRKPTRNTTNHVVRNQNTIVLLDISTTECDVSAEIITK